MAAAIEFERWVLEAAGKAGFMCEIVELGSGQCKLANACIKQETVCYTAIDKDDYSDFADAGLNFIKGDMLDYITKRKANIDICVADKSLNYLPYTELTECLQGVAKLMGKDSQLIFSFFDLSIANESGASKSIEARHKRLDPKIQALLGIYDELTLISVEEMILLLKQADLRLKTVISNKGGLNSMVAVLR